MNKRAAKALRKKAILNTKGQSAGHTEANYKQLKKEYYGFKSDHLLETEEQKKNILQLLHRKSTGK